MDEQQLRISDAERETAAAELGGHYAEGRLTSEEHAERLDRVWSARTRGELRPVFADLPRATVSAPVRRRAERRRSRVFPIVALIVIAAILAQAPWLLLLPLVAFVAVRRRTGLDRWPRPSA